MNIARLAFSFGLLFIAVTVHEFAHGFTAYKLGDPTAKYSGRLTLNPLAHIDIFWSVILPLLLFLSTNGAFVFGTAKPVPINYWALKNPKRDIIWIGLSGPAANFIFAIILSILVKFLISPLAQEILKYLILINVVLGVFNLIPIPPMDGSRILGGILPQGLANKYAQLERYGLVIVIILLWLGMIDKIIWPLVYTIIGWLGVSF